MRGVIGTLGTQGSMGVPQNGNPPQIGGLNFGVSDSGYPAKLVPQTETSCRNALCSELRVDPKAESPVLSWGIDR